MSLIHFDFILYRQLGKYWISGCCLLISSPSMTEELSWLPWMFVLFAENRLAVYNVGLLLFYFVFSSLLSWICLVSLLTLIQCCLAYCGSIVYLDNRKYDVYNFLIFFFCLWLYVLLEPTLEYSFFWSYNSKEYPWCFIGIVVYLKISLGSINIYYQSLKPWTWMVFPPHLFV